MKRTRATDQLDIADAIYEMVTSPSVQRKLITIPYKGARQRLLSEGGFLMTFSTGRACVAALTDPLHSSVPELPKEALVALSTNAPVAMYLLSLADKTLIPRLAATEAGMQILKRHPTLSYTTLVDALLIANNASSVIWLSQRLRRLPNEKMLACLTSLSDQKSDKLVRVYDTIDPPPYVSERLLCAAVKNDDEYLTHYLLAKGVSATAQVDEQFPGSLWNAMQIAVYTASEFLELLMPKELSGELLYGLCAAAVYSDSPNFARLARLGQVVPEIASEAALHALDKNQRYLFMQITEHFECSVPARLMRAAMDGIPWDLRNDLDTSCLAKDLLLHFGLCWHKSEESTLWLCTLASASRLDLALWLTLLEEALSFEWLSVARYLLPPLLSTKDPLPWIQKWIFGYLPLWDSLRICSDFSLVVPRNNMEIIAFAAEHENSEVAKYLRD